MSELDLLDRIRERLATTAQPLEAVIRDSGGIADDTALAQLSRQVNAELIGAGPLEPLLALPGVTDVLVNGPHEVWIDRDGLELTSVGFRDDAAVRRLAQRLAAATGRRLDDASPFVDATLPDGTRLHAILPPLVAHPTLSLRVLARRQFDVADLVAADLMDDADAEVLRAVVAARLAFVISGGTGTGKTTLLGALLSTCEVTERLVVIEDSAEVVVRHPHVIRLLGRTVNVEGAGGVGPAELVRQALRMRPDRLVVGEFRGAEFAELLAALNTGHTGGAATVHANSVADVLPRFAALGSLAGLSVAAVRVQVASAFQVIVSLRRGRDGRRQLAEVAVLATAVDGQPIVVPVLARARSGRELYSAGCQHLNALLAARDVDAPELLR